MKSTSVVAVVVVLALWIAGNDQVQAAPSHVETINLEAQGINADFEDPNLFSLGNQPLFLRGNLGPGWTAFVPDTNGINFGVHRPRIEHYNTLAPLPFPFEGGQFGFLNMDRNGVSAEGVGRGAILSNSVARLGTGKTYALNVGVGARNEVNWADITYELGLRELSSGTDLGTFSSVRMTPGEAPTNLVDLQYTLDVDRQAPGYVGRDVGIVIRGINHGEYLFTQMNFDNIRLTAVAGPTTPLVQVEVPGTANPWLAGMIDGTMADRVDTAPQHAPVLAAGLDLEPGIVHFAATGAVTYNPLEPRQPPDGNANYLYAKLAEHGKSQLVNRMSSLVGVFLDDSEPADSPTPSPLDFTDDFDFHSLSPMLKQPFFIGDGRADDGTLHDFHVPAGATRLFLGTHDGFDWRNNQGAFQVTVWAVPEPVSLVALLGALVALAVSDCRCLLRR